MSSEERDSQLSAMFDGESLVKDLPSSAKSHYRILDCGMKSFPI